MKITRAVGDLIRLHDLPKTTPPLLDLYESQMENITQILLGSGAKHVLYALTTPFEADHAPGCGPYVRTCPVPCRASQASNNMLTASLTTRMPPTRCTSLLAVRKPHTRDC